MRLFALPDADLQFACFRAYNDWIVEFAGADRSRLVPLALISLYDIPEAVLEIERTARLGIAGAVIWGAPPETRPSYGSSVYGPFWEAAASLGLPVSLHCITSGSPRVRSTSTYVQYLDVIHDVQCSLAEIVCSGVLDRWPTLTIVSAENDCGWFPHFLFRLDHAHERFGKFAAAPLKMPPSAYVYRQVYATFQEDSTVPLLCGDLGIDRYMWASDYPHVDSTWPDSRGVIAQALGALPDAVVTKLVGGNAGRLYLGLP